MSKEKKQNKVQWFFMVIFIPAVFALILAVVILYYLGIDVGARVQQAVSFLPFIESPSEEEENDISLEEKVVQLEHENKIYESRIQELENVITQLEEQIIQYQEAKEEGEGENGDGTGELNDDEIVESVSLKEVVKTLEGMTTSKAANIVSELDETEATTYLRMMRVDVRSQILSKMDPQKAAKLISLLGN